MSSRSLALAFFAATLVVATIASNSSSRAASPDPRIVEQGAVGGSSAAYVANRITVRFGANTPPGVIQALSAQNAAQIKKGGGPSGTFSLELPPNADINAVLDAYRTSPFVEEAGLARAVQLFAAPNDTNYAYQWHLQDGEGGLWAESAWSVASNHGAGVTVAVIDTGAPFETFTRPAGSGLPMMSFVAAPDLAGANFVHPWNYIHNDDHPNDDNGHGSHVIGTIRQSTGNSYGVAGVAYEANIMPLKVLDWQGSGIEVDLNDAIYDATNNGADVISMSLGFPETGAPDENSVVCSEIIGLNAALDYAASHGVVIVAASGNDGLDTVNCPAANPHVISVGATGFNGSATTYSTRGQGLDVVAPGGDPSTDVNGDGFSDGVLQETYCNPGSYIILLGLLGGTANFNSFCDVFMSGTSMATPHVTGIAALLLGEDQTLTPAEVRALIQGTARDRGAVGWDSVYGWGLVDAFAAVTALDGDSGLTPTPTSTNSPTPTTTPTPTMTPTPPPAGVVVTSVSPSSVNQCNCSFAVTITGFGFAANASVQFDGGSGPTPSVSNVVVAADGLSLTAMVRLKNGGPARPRVWNVRVTNPNGVSGVLVGGFTVLP